MLELLSETKVGSSAAARKQNHTVRIQAGALDESEVRDGSIVLRGRIAAASLHRLLVDHEYQRPLGVRPEIDAAIRAGCVLPDVVLGCRGSDYSREGDDFLLKDQTYIIDGWQRIGTARAILEQIPHLEIRIGCLVHFGTTQEFEAALFTDLNKGQKRVASNLHLRNLRTKSNALLTLYGLSNNDQKFPIAGRVCWAQNMARQDLVTAVHMAKATQYLHGHIVGISGQRAEELASKLDELGDKITLQAIRFNVSAFFNLIEECWGLRKIEYRSAAPQVKGQFLNVLARLLSRHRVFWSADDRLLKVDSATKSRLRSFPIQDPQIRQLAGSSGAAKEILYETLLAHINKGRRDHRLKARDDE